MAKVDIKHAFHICPVHSRDWPLLCYQWSSTFYVELRLPFGSHSSPYIFNLFVDTLQWIALNVAGVSALLHYLDDFFLVNVSNALCATDLECFVRLCDALNVPLAPDKLVAPTTVMQYLGIIIDSVQQEIRLPQDKLGALIDRLPGWHGRETCTKKELLSLIGTLSFACKVVKPGRMFLRRLINLSTQARTLQQTIRLNAAARADIQWWIGFLPGWNGREFFQAPPVNAHELGFTTDASDVGIGAVFGADWISEAFPAHFGKFHINVKELFAVVVAVHSWGWQWRDMQVVIATDNMTIVHVWHTGSCKCENIMALIRRLFFFLAERNVNLLLEHVPGTLNVDADLCSRFQVTKFVHDNTGQFNDRTSVPADVWHWL